MNWKKGETESHRGQPCRFDEQGNTLDLFDAKLDGGPGGKREATVAFPLIYTAHFKNFMKKGRASTRRPLQ